MSYSQNDEEKHILDYLGEASSSTILLDIGAYDGQAKSNTLALMECGWIGVFVEPSPIPFQRLLQLHGRNNKAHLVHALVGLESGMKKFWPSPDCVSTTEEKHFESWNGKAPYDAPFLMPQITVPDLLRNFLWLAQVDMISLDIEGTNFPMFKEILRYVEPRLFCVEKDSPQLRGEMNHIADCYSYKLLYESGENMVYVK